MNNSWSRYRLVRDTLQNTEQASEFLHLDISQQISKAIADDVATMPQQANQSHPWWKPAAGFAVAASVAMAVVFGVQTTEQSNPDFNTIAAGSQPAISSRAYPLQSVSMQASSSGAVSLPPNQLPGAAAGKAAANLETQKHLEKYMLRHTERAALHNGQGIIPLARVTNFEQQ